jgi:hypothetical protein
MISAGFGGAPSVGVGPNSCALTGLSMKRNRLENKRRRRGTLDLIDEIMLQDTGIQ